MYRLTLNQVQMIKFVMVDTSSLEVPNLGSGFVLQISKAGGAFAPSTGTKAEIGSGWYRYTFTAAELDTVGPLAVKVTGAGAVQQNLAYVVQSPGPGAIPFTYTVTNSVTSAPLDGVEVWITTDLAGSNVIWRGTTDASGVARDEANNLPRLDAGVVYFWRQKAGFVFSDPDTETVS